jgi:hypothetical protein
MRPLHQIARERLQAVMARSGPMRAPELALALDVSGPTLLRMLKEQADDVVAAGQARRRRYAWRRDLRGDKVPLPVYAIDEQGRAMAQPPLMLTQPQGSCCLIDAACWPVPTEAQDGWWDGLPYPLQDMRPQGYIGRQFARAYHRSLRLPDNLLAWSDDDVLWAMSQEGHDQVGDIIVGQVAFERWQRSALQTPDLISVDQIGSRYAELAQQAVAQGVPGSSAAGEFPKFTALRDLPGALTPHVIVKFSGADGSAAVQRWSDLLVCEHLALEAMRALPDVTVSRSRIVQHAGRTFMESERFDRHGLRGRSPLVSLGTLNAEWLGSARSDWILLARSLAAMALLDDEQVQQVARMWWFGRLIGNTDMHTGNLSFVPHGRLTIAPAYDMLPMMHGPLAGGEVPARGFDMTNNLPRPEDRTAWQQALAAAQIFWQQVLVDARISEGFKQVARQHAQQLHAAGQLI